MKVVALVQARLGSTRLPEKIIARIGDQMMLTHVVARLAAASTIDEVHVIAPVDEASLWGWTLGDNECAIDDQFDAWFPSCPTDDLIRRHLIAASDAGADVVVRVPSDNPCVDPEQVDRMVRHYLAKPSDEHLFSNIQPLSRNKYADGFGGEVYSRKLLEWMDANIPVPFHGQKKRGVPGPGDREHPHRHFIRVGKVRTIVAPPDARDMMLRFDVNDATDLAFVRDVFRHCWRPHRHFTMREAIDFVHGYV